MFSITKDYTNSMVSIECELKKKDVKLFDYFTFAWKSTVYLIARKNI